MNFQIGELVLLADDPKTLYRVLRESSAFKGEWRIRPARINMGEFTDEHDRVEPPSQLIKFNPEEIWY